MAINNQLVTIKGNKDGLVFLLNDQIEFEALLDDLRNKLEHTHQQILTGPLVHVFVKLGSRRISPEQEEQIRQLIRRNGNLIVRSIETDHPEPPPSGTPWHVVKGLVRSGQTLEVEGDLLYIGDVNPGGLVKATGSIYILGALKGIAHAGAAGDEQSIIAASLMHPMQLRIAGIISRPPDEWGYAEDPYMEFAYLRDGAMEIDKITHLHRIRPEALPAATMQASSMNQALGLSAGAAVGKGE